MGSRMWALEGQNEPPTLGEASRCSMKMRIVRRARRRENMGEFVVVRNMHDALASSSRQL